MNQLSKKHNKSGTAYLLWGGGAMAGSVILFLLGFLYLNLIYIPAHSGPSEDLPAILILSGPILIEFVFFLFGFVLVIVGVAKNVKNPLYFVD